MLPDRVIVAQSSKKVLTQGDISIVHELYIAVMEESVYCPNPHPGIDGDIAESFVVDPPKMCPRGREFTVAR